MQRIIPKTITAGHDFRVSVSAQRVPAGAESLSLVLRGPAAVDLQTDAPSGYVFEAAGVVTAQWGAGEYAYEIRAHGDGGSVTCIESGLMSVRPDLAQAGAGHDGRSEARKALAAIEAVIAKRATLDQERYRINNRELYRTPIAELLRLRAHYVEVVRRESGGGAGFRRYRVRFGGGR